MSTTATTVASAIRSTPRARGTTFLLWLRRVHLYVGLWGAVLGFAFGATGILLNHRAILRIPVDKTVQSTLQMAVPAGGFASPAAFRAWVQERFALPPEKLVMQKIHAAATVPWGDARLVQPERWTLNFQAPRRVVVAEYFAGAATVRLEQSDATAIGFLTRLHMSAGASAAWVLLADSIAGSLLLLSVTGVLLWTRLNRIRLATCAVAGGALLLAIGIAATM